MIYRTLASAVAATLLGITPVAHADENFDAGLEAIAEHDYPCALERIGQSAAGGNPRAQQVLGFMLLFGEALYRGVPRDETAAALWLSLAAEQGDEVARWALERSRRGEEVRIALQPVR